MRKRPQADSSPWLVSPATYTELRKIMIERGRDGLILHKNTPDEGLIIDNNDGECWSTVVVRRKPCRCSRLVKGRQCGQTAGHTGKCSLA